MTRSWQNIFIKSLLENYLKDLDMIMIDNLWNYEIKDQLKKMKKVLYNIFN